MSNRYKYTEVGCKVNHGHFILDFMDIAEDFDDLGPQPAADDDQDDHGSEPVGDDIKLEIHSEVGLNKCFAQLVSSHEFCTS